ncbi:hypothetical protein DPMN_110680 [Dreissena polymorpha]|uniref:peptidylglycine monooxygenase n=2 Tax=Dreissena polymorpha TaxID=45954 RepID=A0A9D4KD17_DREPO|nr:hypothetical protein DPMN_110680 [Dreissena polymorpha]
MEVLYLLVVSVSVVLGAPSGVHNVTHVDYLMPEVQPKQADTYLCNPLKMGKEVKYIIGFEPHANMAIAHHILLYGCEEPGSHEVWNCGEMASKTSSYKVGPVCSSGAKILYAWAMDAPALTLPEDVGFKVGGDTGINYLVLQVHYKDVTSFLPPKNSHDSSGITMTMTDTPQRRRAGVYLLGTGGYIDAHTVTYMETECPFQEKFDVHPFAFRTHAHGLGMVTSGYRIRDGQWTEIGRQTPQKPQMFYNSTTPGLVIHQGDILAARCTMKNDLDRRMYIGSTQNDEMCNFYMMYYTEGDDIIPGTYCFSQGPPSYYWADDINMRNAIKNIPPNASVVPGESKPLKQTAVKGKYEDKNTVADDYSNLYDVKGANMNTDLASMPPLELHRLLTYLRSRGPRSYDDDLYY